MAIAQRGSQIRYYDEDKIVQPSSTKLRDLVLSWSCWLLLGDMRGLEVGVGVIVGEIDATWIVYLF